jgi:SAM-dependent methyltransferase
VIATQCVVCGGSVASWLDMPIDAKTFEPTGYGKVLRCTQCGHGSVSPLPSADEVPHFYALEAYYTQGSSHMVTEPDGVLDRVLSKLAWSFDHGVDLDQALSALKLSNGSKVCEIGCGHAKNLVDLRGRGHSVVGVDPDPKAVAEAAKIGIEVLLGTGEVLPERIRADQFDLVIMSHSLEHCIDPMLAAKNVASILRPGGVFVCEVPNSGSTHFLWNNICSEMFDAPRHLHFYNTESLSRSIEGVGLKINSVSYTGFTRHHARGWRKVEQKIRAKLLGAGGKCPKEHTFMKSMLLWFVTCLATAPKKYDSLRVVTVK